MASPKLNFGFLSQQLDDQCTGSFPFPCVPVYLLKIAAILALVQEQVLKHETSLLSWRSFVLCFLLCFLFIQEEWQ